MIFFSSEFGHDNLINDIIMSLKTGEHSEDFKINVSMYVKDVEALKKWFSVLATRNHGLEIK